MKLMILFLGMISSLSLWGQDSVLKRFELSASLNFTHIGYPRNAPVSAPERLRRLRERNTILPVDGFTLTDNPQNHGALYAMVKLTTRLSPGITIHSDLYLEHRGVSYGIFSKGNNIVLPVLKAEGRDSFRFGSKFLKLDAAAGYFLDEREDEGLTIYNMDLQGVKAKLGMGSWSLGYTIYGDLNRGIGLGIDDQQSVRLEREWKGKGRIGFSVINAYRPNLRKLDYLAFSLYGHRHFGPVKLYAQAGYRKNPNDGLYFREGPAFQSAMLAGAEWKVEKKALSWKNQLEVRYYGQSFNSFYTDYMVRYRQPVNSSADIYANTTGSFIYPLRRVGAPFSQWAVFTETQGANSGGISLTGDIQYKIRTKFSIFNEYDLNLYMAGQVKPNNIVQAEAYNFFYPFFTAGFKYHPAKQVAIAFLVTNRAMNLDLSYPTLYWVKRPHVGLRMVVDSW